MDIMNNLNNKLNEEAIISIINALIDKDGFNMGSAPPAGYQYKPGISYPSFPF